MKRAIHPIKADMMRLHRIFPAKFGLALMLAFGLLFGIFLKKRNNVARLWLWRLWGGYWFPLECNRSFCA